MPICSYVVFPRQGRGLQVARRLGGIPGCSVQAAEDSDLLLLLTETAEEEAEVALQQTLEKVEDLECMVLTFGEVDGKAPKRPDRRRRAGGAL